MSTRGKRTLCRGYFLVLLSIFHFDFQHGPWTFWILQTLIIFILGNKPMSFKISDQWRLWSACCSRVMASSSVHRRHYVSALTGLSISMFFLFIMEISVGYREDTLHPLHCSPLCSEDLSSCYFDITTSKHACWSGQIFDATAMNHQLVPTWQC